MASVIFESAQRIISQIFEWLQTSGQEKTNAIITDTFNSGINNATSSGEGFLIVPGNNNTSLTPSVNITLGGIAYDPSGSRIFIDPSDTTLYNPSNINSTTNDGLGNFLPTPQSTGVVNVPLTQSSQNYLWINYLSTIDTSSFTLNEETNAKQFYKQTDGYNIRVTITNVPPDDNSIFLGSVNMIFGGAVAPSNISQVGRMYYQILPNVVPITTPLADNSDRTPTYAPASTYTLEAHIKAVGTGTGISPTNPHNQSLSDFGVSALDTVAAHRQLEHGNAIIAGTVGDAYPTTSAMACTIAIVNPGSDHIIVRQLLSSQVAIINGTGYSNTEIFGAVPADAVVMFPNTSGTYNLYWDSITKSFAVTTGSISSDVTKLWLCTVTYTFVGTGPSDHNALSALIERRRIGSTVEKYQRWVTTARPPVPLPGEYGFNLDINAPEYFDGVAWQSLGVLTGSIIDFASSTIPTGYLQCDGSAVSRTTFANLFAVIGTIWGIGDGSTTFNIPDFRRKVAVGSGGTGTGTLGNTVGNTGGTETVTPIQNQHQHATGVGTRSDEGAIYVIRRGSWAPGTTTVTSVNVSGVPDSNVNDTVVTLNTDFTTATNQASSVIQPSAVVTKIIKF